MRKTLLIVGIILALILTGISTVQAANATASLKSSASTVKPGDTFTVTLSANCDDGINGIIGNEASQGFGFSYDTSKLELVSREAKIMSDANDGENTIALVYLGANPVNSGDFYTFTFKVKADASGSATVSTTAMEVKGLENDSTTSIPAQSVSVNISTDAAPANTSTPTNGGSSTSGTSTPAKSGTSTDSTTATKNIPAAGRVALGGVVVVAIIGAVVAFKKTHNIEI